MIRISKNRVKKIAVLFFLGLLASTREPKSQPSIPSPSRSKNSQGVNESKNSKGPQNLHEEALRQYRVIALKGEILALFSWSTSWKIIKKGMILEENVLLQNLAPAVVELTLINSGFNNGDEASIRLDLFQPTMLRLTKPTGRTLVIRSGLVSTEQLKFPFNEKAMSELSAVKPLGSAWYRTQNMTTVLAPNVKTFKKMIQTKQGKALPSIRKDWGKIVIRQPQDGTVFIVEKFPLKISVDWEVSGPIEANMKKEIFLWQENEEPEEPILVTLNSPAMIEVPRAGSYFIGVATEDRMVVSDQIIISLE